MSTSNASTAAPSAATTAAQLHAPTVSQAVKIDWGSWITQGFTHEQPIIEALAAAGIHAALASVPYGSIVEHFVGPKLIHQYVDMARVALGGAVDGRSIELPAGKIYETVGNLINNNESAFAGFMGDKLDPLIKGTLAKIGVAL